jgi:hypothetical protein
VTCTICGTLLTGRQRRVCSIECRSALFSGSGNPKFNDGLTTSQGRTLIVNRDGTMTLYYRAVMEAHLGRELRSGEIVHHINGDPSDDRIENLVVMSQREHFALHKDEIVAARVDNTNATRAVELYESGLSLQAVARTLDYRSMSPVRRFLREAGVSARRPCLRAPRRVA